MFEAFGLACYDDDVVLFEHLLWFGVHEVVLSTFDTHDDAVGFVAYVRLDDGAADEWVAFFEGEVFEGDVYACFGFLFHDTAVDHLLELIDLLVASCYDNLIAWIDMGYW